MKEGTGIAHEINRRVQRAIPQVDRVLIHYQPEHHSQITLCVAVNEDCQTICQHIGTAPFFREEKGRGIKVASWLVEKGTDVYLSAHDKAGKGSHLVFGNAGVEIFLTEENDSGRAIETALEQFGGLSE